MTPQERFRKAQQARALANSKRPIPAHKRQNLRRLATALVAINMLEAKRKGLSSHWLTRRYEQLKPLFLEAASEFAGSHKDVSQLARNLVEELKAGGFSMNVLRNMRPYLEQFVQDVQDGAIELAQRGKANR